MENEFNEIIVFYSWQSDLPEETNRRFIRESLRNASSVVEEKCISNNLRIDLDEAKRSKPGSANIPQTILEKIKVADIFVCDITTINKSAPDEYRRVPNPNVLIELGYAIAFLGWERIILLFNTSFGTLSLDAPFDIDRHRISPYDFGLLSDEQKKLSKKQLSAANIGLLCSLLDLSDFGRISTIGQNSAPVV